MGSWYGELGTDVAFNPGAVEFDTNVVDAAATLSNPGPFAYGVLISGTGSYSFELSLDVDTDVAGHFPATLSLYDATTEATLYNNTDPNTVGTGASTVTVSWTVNVTTDSIAEIAFPGDDAEGTIFAGSSWTITEPSPRNWWLGVVGFSAA